MWVGADIGVECIDLLSAMLLIAPLLLFLAPEQTHSG